MRGRCLMSSGDPICPCGCGSWLGQCSGRRDPIPFGGPPPALSPLGMSGPEAVELFVSSLPLAERNALIERLTKQSARAVRESIKDTRKPLGAWLRRRREAIGLTQAKVATEVGLSRTAYVNYEAGMQGCTVEILVHLCSVFGADPVDALKEITS